MTEAAANARPAESLYVAVATAHGGREGRTSTDDGRLDVAVSVPTELGGPGAGTNPEQLFAAGFASCFHNALQVVARRSRTPVGGSSVTATVGLGRAERHSGYELRVHLDISLPGIDRATAEGLVSAADAVCPYANAVRGNIPLTHQLS